MVVPVERQLPPDLMECSQTPTFREWELPAPDDFSGLAFQPVAISRLHCDRMPVANHDLTDHDVFGNHSQTRLGEESFLELSSRSTTRDGAASLKQNASS